MKRFATIALGVFFLGTGSASATTIVAEDGSPDYPYQEWVDHAKVPTRPGVVTVTERADLSAPADCGAHVFGCTDGEGVWLQIPGLKVAHTFRHELGHGFVEVYAEQVMNPFAALTTPEAKGVFDDELFADMYAICARRTPKAGRWDGPVWSVKRAQAICRLIRALRNR